MNTRSRIVSVGVGLAACAFLQAQSQPPVGDWVSYGGTNWSQK